MSAPLVITFVSGSGGYEGASGCCPVSPAESDGDGDIYADGDHKIKKKGDVLGLCGYLPVYNLDQKFLHVHKLLLRSV